MRYMCHFGQSLAIYSEDITLTSFFIDLYDPGDLEDKAKVTKSNSL